MIKNNFKIAFRYLWKNKLFTGLNIIGLTIGISACWIILSIVNFELSHDAQIPERDNIYRLVTGRVFDGKETIYGGVSAPFVQGIREEVQGLKAVVPLFTNFNVNTVIIRKDGAPLTEVDEPTQIVFTDSSYFSMVPYQWLAGNQQQPFPRPESVVLTASRAQEYFPGVKASEIIGMPITYYNYEDTVTRSVSGIVADLDFPTEFQAKELMHLTPKIYPLNEWTNTNGGDKIYLITESNTTKNNVLNQIEKLGSRKWMEFKREREVTYEFKRRFELRALKDMHFATDISDYLVRKVSKPVLLGLIATALFLLLLACINYINLCTAQIPQRGKEIGVRKTLGSSKTALIAQLLCETIIIICIALLLSILITHLGFATLNTIIPDGAVVFQYNGSTLWILAGILLLTTIVTGLYPAIQISRIKPIESIKNGLSKKSGKSSYTLRKGLIIFQYTIAQCFIISALIIGQQLRYTLQKDMGFNKEGVALLEIPWNLSDKDPYANKEKPFVEALSKIKGITQITRGRAPLSDGYSSSPYIYTPENGAEPISRQLQRKIVDTGYLSFYQIALIAGRNIAATDTTKELVINEAAMEAYGWTTPQEALGKQVKNGNNYYPIVGVISNFHAENFYVPIAPLLLATNNENTNNIALKLPFDMADWQATIQEVQNTWNLFYPADKFSYEFYDERIKALYEDDQRTGTLINIAAGISIFIGCLGLFGLATLTAFQRTKEIGVRKVLGASVNSIVTLLSKDFVKLVVIAIVIATPVAWWVMNKWLTGFIYKITLSPWIFIAAGILAIIIAVLTVSIQAIKAAMNNPVESLRDE